MKKYLAASVLATVLAASSTLAFSAPATQPTEALGPQTWYADSQPVRGTEGPDIRLADNQQSGQPVKGTEGPDIRQTDDQKSSQPVRGTEGPDVR